MLVFPGLRNYSSCGKQRTNDSDVVLGSLELPEGNIDGDTTLTLGL